MLKSFNVKHNIYFFNHHTGEVNYTFIKALVASIKDAIHHPACRTAQNFHISMQKDSLPISHHIKCAVLNMLFKAILKIV